jgi:WD40-like Beta Propeller Repeat
MAAVYQEGGLWPTRPWRARLAYSVLGAMLLALACALPAGAAPADGLIVFESDRGGRLDLWTMRSDGSGASKLTNDKVNDVFPEWSPSGKRMPGPEAASVRAANSG